jgi:hypothetical protein
MKYLSSLLSIVFLISCNQKGNMQTKAITKTKIDSVTSAQEIKALLVKLDANLKDFEIVKPNDFKGDNTGENHKKIADSLGIQSSFIKADFDGNGYNDLLVTGAYNNNFNVYIVYGKPKNKFEIKSLLMGHFRACVYPKLNYIDKIPLIDLYSVRDNFEGKKQKQVVDKKTLVYKFDNLIEYNKAPKAREITSIEFSTSGCYGTCPIYQLTLNKAGKSIFRAQHYNFSQDMAVDYDKEEGLFYRQLTKAEYKKIVDYLNYFDFESLKNEYSVSWTDDQTAVLKITYDNGKVKKINDYGMIGTYGLKIVYEKLAALRFEGKWVKK